MKALVLNGSPWRDRGNTWLILGPFIEGIKEAGAEVEVVHTVDLKIRPCVGCFSCWVKHPGECVFKDDMGRVLELMKVADALVLATPLYVDGMASTLKNVLDRTLPLAEPFFEERDGRCRHPIREGVKRDGVLALVSNCGYWELENFNPLVEHVKAVCGNIDRRFAGALLRPHGPALRAMMRRGMPVDGVLGAAKEAGRAFVERGEIPEELQKAVSAPLIPKDKYIEVTNRFFERCIEEGRFLIEA